MSKMTFKHEHEDLTITNEFEDDHILEVVEQFKSFLRNVGYVFDDLEVINENQ